MNNNYENYYRMNRRRNRTSDDCTSEDNRRSDCRREEFRRSDCRREDCRNTSDENRRHVHEFLGSTKFAEQGRDRHNHRFAGVTCEAIRCGNSHVHKLRTNTTDARNPEVRTVIMNIFQLIT